MECSCDNNHNHKASIAARKSKGSFVDNALDYASQALFAAGGAGSSMLVDVAVNLLVPTASDGTKTLVKGGKALLGLGIASNAGSKNIEAYGAGMFVEAASSTVRSVIGSIAKAFMGDGSTAGVNPDSSSNSTLTNGFLTTTVNSGTSNRLNNLATTVSTSSKRPLYL